MITREDAKKLLPIIKAYVEGKEIQFFNCTEEWVDRETLSFDNEPHRYRIKPELKYRPFKSIEECWEEMKKHQPFGWVKVKVKDKLLSNKYNVLDLNTYSDFDYRYNNYTFADGTPYGIKEEEKEEE